MRGLCANSPQLPDIPEQAKRHLANSELERPGSKVNARFKLDWPALESAVKEALRMGHYAYSTEKSYLSAIRDFVRFHNFRKPSTMGENEIVSYLYTHVLNKGPLGVISPLDTL